LRLILLVQCFLVFHSSPASIYETVTGRCIYRLSDEVQYYDPLRGTLPKIENQCRVAHFSLQLCTLNAM
jgi:hypothetical protein